MDTLFYENFFERDSLLYNDSLFFHPPGYYSSSGQFGMPVELIPDTLQHNDSITLLLFICLFLLLVVTLLRRRTLAQQISNFFYPQTSQHLTSTASENLNLELTTALFAIVSCLLAATLFFTYAQTYWNLWLIPLTSLQLLGLYAALCFLVLLLKQLLFRIVNTVFFNRDKRHLWRQSYGFLIHVEGVLLLPVTLMAVYFDYSSEKVAYVVLFLLLFVKSLVLYKDFTYFFDKFYGLLHLFVYFCALEAAPLLVLWTVMSRLTNYLTTTL